MKLAFGKQSLFIIKMKYNCLNFILSRIWLFLASEPITSWQVEGEKVETVIDFIFLGSKITVACGYSHEIQRHLLLGRKAMRNIVYQKSRDMTLLTKVCIVRVIVFPVVMYVCKSWTIKNAEH